MIPTMAAALLAAMLTVAPPAEAQEPPTPPEDVVTCDGGGCVLAGVLVGWGYLWLTVGDALLSGLEALGDTFEAGCVDRGGEYVERPDGTWACV